MEDGYKRQIGKNKERKTFLTTRKLALLIP